MKRGEKDKLSFFLLLFKVSNPERADVENMKKTWETVKRCISKSVLAEIIGREFEKLNEEN